jgi:alkylation response protein AidB-like acyl-CoA dehydrogenase
VVGDSHREFAFTDEQRALRTAVRRFSAENFDEATVRRLMESEPRFDPAVWRRLGSELGVLGMSVPEADGGVGGSLVDQAVAVEEFGSALACGPLFGTVYLAIPALVACPAGPARDTLLTGLVEGERTAAFAVPERGGAFDPSALRVTADADTLTGVAERVVDADSADEFLVAARASSGISLYAVAADAPGVRRTPLVTMDLTRPQATIAFDGAAARLLAGPGGRERSDSGMRPGGRERSDSGMRPGGRERSDSGMKSEVAERVITHAIEVGTALLAIEQVGAAQHLLDLSVDYAKSRLQFGRQIGSFQAIKHKLADMLVDLEHARSAAYHAVWALSDGSDDPALAVSIAAALSSAALQRIATDTIQIHGGIGFTWEHQAQLYFKRAATDAALLGSAEQHRSRVAELVLDTAIAHSGAVRVATGQP